MLLVLEISAIFFAILYLIFVAFESNWCWIFAAISTFIYVFICYKSKLYLETILQFFYLIMAFYGWYQWNNKKNTSNIIYSVKLKLHIILILLAELFSLIAGFIFSEYTDAALPWVDAHITMFSIVATYMVTKKMIENWFWWIVIDCFATYLYFSKNLKLTALLYIAYVIMSIFGYYKWKKEIQK